MFWLLLLGVVIAESALEKLFKEMVSESDGCLIKSISEAQGYFVADRLEFGKTVLGPEAMSYDWVVLLIVFLSC